MPASSPLRPAAARGPEPPESPRRPDRRTPNATRAAPSSGTLRSGGVNSPEAPRAGASSIARRTEPPSTLKCGRYPNPCAPKLPNLGPLWLNKVYLNGADFQAFRQDDGPCLLQVTTGAGDWVYLAQALDAVERGVLSLGYAQREETCMREGDDVTIQRWFPSPASSLTTLRLCVAPYGWAEEGPRCWGRAHIDAADLERFVKEKFSGQVFKEGQKFVVMYDPYCVGDSCILPCADTRIGLDVTVEHSCTVNGKPTQCVEFAGQRPWPRFGQLVEGTAVQVYQDAGTGRSLNLRRNPNTKVKVPLIVRDAIHAVLAIALVTLILVKGLLWFLVSTVSGPLGPSQDIVETLAAESPTSFVAFCGRTAWWAALKFALCNVLAYGGYRVLGYVLPFLRFFSQIGFPW